MYIDLAGGWRLVANNIAFLYDLVQSRSYGSFAWPPVRSIPVQHGGWWSENWVGLVMQSCKVRTVNCVQAVGGGSTRLWLVLNCFAA